MKKTIVIYGSSTGTCEMLANQIAEQLGVECINVADMTIDTLSAYDNFLLGTSTWGVGDPQDDWFDGITTLQTADLNNKTFALFGCGDSQSYGDTFCAGMAVIKNAIIDKGCNFIGNVSTEGYDFVESEAVVDNQFIGLAIDDINEDDKTNQRIKNWLAEITPLL